MAFADYTRKKLGKYLYKSTYSRAFFKLYGLVIKEIRVSFSQFYTWKYPVTSLFRVFFIMLSSLNRLLLGRSLKYSFAFTGEDILLDSIYKPLITYNGFYVDVGCNHPCFLSNTYSFYRKGWRGICVDANPDLIKKFNFYRPQDKAVTALVSDTVEDRKFYLIQNNVLSTTEEVNLELAKEEGMTYEVSQYKTRTLTSILEEHHAPNVIDILSIDAEEHDFNVLKSLDLNTYTPKLIIVEDDTFDVKNPDANLFYSYLMQYGYSLAGFILTNLYFKKEPFHN